MIVTEIKNLKLDAADQKYKIPKISNKINKTKKKINTITRK